MIYQGILLQEPLVKRTPAEELRLQEESTVEDYSLDADDEEDTGGLVVIRSAKK